MNTKIACIQIQPFFLDITRTVNKICDYIDKASRQKSDLVVFPELILSGYPNFSIYNHEYRKKYYKTAICIDGPEIQTIAKKAEKTQTAVVLGFVERDRDFPEVIYDSSCIIDMDGSILGTHRKIVPLGAEKMVFKEGDARDIRVFKTGVGKIGIGLCFEHLNPLYRKALSLLGEEIHCALWVNSEDIRHVVDSCSIVTALEAGVFVALVSQITSNLSTDSLGRGQHLIGGSGILNPWGKYITGPKFGHEDILYADVDVSEWNADKFQSRGIEARDDLLSLNIVKEPYHSFHILENKNDNKKGQVFLQ